MMLDFRTLILNHGISPKGVIQIGCHYFQEKPVFQALGVENYVLVEPQKEAFEIAKSASSDLPNVTTFNCALSDNEGKLEMNCDSVNQGQSSSILEPLLHTEKYPTIAFDRKETVELKKLDNLKFDRELFNIIVIDVQGAELLVFKGGVNTLKTIDAIYAEVNFIEMYKGCVLIDELDLFLKEFGFVRVATGADNGGWSDSFYVKSEFVKGEDLDSFLFNEKSYLENNPDVAAYVATGQNGTAYEHYVKFGKSEGREI